MRDFAEELGQRVLLFDGAMGTEIYRRGVFINRSFEELNLSSPALIRDIHEAYLRAGAEILTTNTFGANAVRMAEFGLKDRTDEINTSAVRIARQVAGDNAWVAGSIGPIGQALTPVGKLTPGKAFACFKQQAIALSKSGDPEHSRAVDLFILETFYDIRELWQAVRAVKAVTDKPIIACMAFSEQDGRLPPDAENLLLQASEWDVQAIGINCGSGPKPMLDLVESASKKISQPILAMPNAGRPQEVDGRLLYMASPEYMAEYARRFVQKGAKLMGGCCGTTPATIKDMATFLRSVSPRIQVQPRERKPELEEVTGLEPTPIAERSEFARKLTAGKFCISVELDPPRGVDPSRSVEGATYLKKQGIDVINIADGPRAIARMGPVPLAMMAKEACGMESVVHYCCRDRNLLGMQMDLIGANALGLRNILAVTGDPPKMGTYPNATPVFDIDAIGLISFIQMLNRGLDFSGRALKGKTELFVGAGCNPGHIEFEYEVDRFGKKIEAGAEFFFSQPMYDHEALFRFLDRTESFKQVPFLVGILPLASYKNAEFLHHEVPGMQVPADIRERLKKAPDKAAQRAIGIEVARQTLVEAVKHPRICGAYIYPPFGSYKAVMDVVSVLDELDIEWNALNYDTAS